MIDKNRLRRILYIGNFKFPDGNAAGKRVLGNAKLFVNLGYEVTIIGVRNDGSYSGRGLTHLDLVNGFNSYSLPYPKNIFDWMRFWHTYKLIRKFLESDAYREKLFAVILYGSPVLSVFNLCLTLYCRKHNVKVVTDCVDWLTIKTKNQLFDFMKTIDDYFQKAIVNRMADGVICISNYLANYYRSKGRIIVIVPPLADKCDKYLPQIANFRLGDKKMFIYAGRPFRSDMKKSDVGALKDRIDLVLRIFSELRSEGHDFELHIFGFQAVELIECMPCTDIWISNLDGSVKFHGHTSNKIVMDALKRSHFSILIRDNKRDTVAGFPTKVAESICNGTPVLVTDIGDIHIYVKNGLNGFLAPAGDYDLQRLMLMNALELSNDEVGVLKRNCLNSRLFDISEYEERVCEFLANIERKSAVE